ncbi:Hint domain-containing protein [Psychromarinibacter sp. C21-152]|uniref:Hint domain-containing protein n=1 Tax=Psychromarinibacter sediminicola TaxID=3033385 RepID=A0AAE3TBW2_9RHOB|nr:Hint domain-containing protein [Psychromarinibacter sediminicola]MDF0603025.1 Hint domain-containing protein [Psychromarinibacter sediminicola]
MTTGFRGTFVLSWAQTELDGLTGAPVQLLAVGASWQWRGDPARIDGPGDVLVLGDAEEVTNLRRHASKAARRLMGEPETGQALPEPDDPVLDSGFSVTDGLHRYTATLVERAGKPPLCMFLDSLPPKGQELWITHVTSGTSHPHRTGDLTPQVICFTPDTRIATEHGAVPVRDLAEGDRVLTKDDGPQAIRWIGRRRMSGARLYTMPELRPIRIRAGAVGMEVPDDDLLVSPQHRMLVKGPMAQTLYGEAEVLVAARDLLNDASIHVDRRLREVTYVHLLLDRHSVVFANGLETESFHPASMALDAMDPGQVAELAERVPGIDRNPCLYGGFARRMLDPSEAAILQYAARRGH